MRVVTRMHSSSLCTTCFTQTSQSHPIAFWDTHHPPCLSPCMLGYTQPPVTIMTDMCKNITLPLTLWVVIRKYSYRMRTSCWPSGGFRGHPNSFNFMQFLGKFGKSDVGAPPPPRGNPGSAAVANHTRCGYTNTLTPDISLPLTYPIPRHINLLLPLLPIETWHQGYQTPCGQNYWQTLVRKLIHATSFVSVNQSEVSPLPAGWQS